MSMKHPLLGIISLLLVFTLACVGEDTDKGESGDTGGEEQGADWFISDLALQPDSLNYAAVTGVVTLEGDLTGIGTTAEVRYYQDDYTTLIVATSETIGSDLEEIGTTQAFELTHYTVYVLPAIGGYDYVCASFRADDSNYEDWIEVGCLEGVE